MSKEHPPSNLQMIPIDKIEVLNPRDRNGRIFDDIIGNIKNIGLKKPITVTPREDGDGREKFLLICGEGRLKAFKSLGETTIPAMVVNVSDEDGFIMSLAENIARRQGRTLELLAGIEQLRDQGYDKKAIALKTGLGQDYIYGILQLLKNGEERLLIAVESGRIPLNAALAIAGAGQQRQGHPGGPARSLRKRPVARQPPDPGAQSHRKTPIAGAVHRKGGTAQGPGRDVLQPDQDVPARGRTAKAHGQEGGIRPAATALRG